MSDQAAPTITEALGFLDNGLFEDAFIAFRHLADVSPADLNIQSYLHLLETVLFNKYLGEFNLQVMPTINPKYSDRLTQLQLEGNEGYLLTQIDGKTSIKSLIFIAGMGKFRTLRILNKFVQNDIIKV